MKCTPAVNFTYILAFVCTDPESTKKTDNLTAFLVLLGYSHVEAARKMFMKLTPVVNFTNILQAAFALIFLQKNPKPNSKKRKAVQNSFLQNAARKNGGKN